MNLEHKAITEEDKKDWIEIKVRVPKDTIAMIINYLEGNSYNIISMGNVQMDSEDIAKNRLYEQEDPDDKTN